MSARGVRSSCSCLIGGAAHASPAGEADARDHLVRAICTWQQLDDNQHADAALAELRRWKKIEFDPATLCDQIRPIQPPAATP